MPGMSVRPYKIFGRPYKVLAAVLTLGVAGAALAQAGRPLTYKGAVVSRDLRLLGERPYIPLADVARMVGGAAVKSGGGYTIQGAGGDAATGDAATPGDTPAPAGGANEVRGLRGKVGQVLFTGLWRFQVVRVDRTSSYTTKYQPDTETILPRGGSEELVAITCLLKNAQTVTKSAILSPSYPHNTALTDDQGQSYPPLRFDKREFDGGGSNGPRMLPGSSQTFAVLFSVPKGTALKDLVFSLMRWSEDYPNGGTDVRVSLAP